MMVSIHHLPRYFEFELDLTGHWNRRERQGKRGEMNRQENKRRFQEGEGAVKVEAENVDQKKGRGEGEDIIGNGETAREHRKRPNGRKRNSTRRRQRKFQSPESRLAKPQETKLCPEPCEV